MIDYVLIEIQVNVWIILSVTGSGILSALLDQQLTSCPSEQLRVMISGDAVIRPDTDPMPVGQTGAQVRTTTSCWYNM